MQTLKNNNNTLIHRVLLESDILKTEVQRLQMIKFLYNENVNPDGPNNNNLTPLHLACNKQYYTIIKFLIDKGIRLNIYNTSPIGWCVHHNNIKIIKPLLIDLKINNAIGPYPKCTA